MRGQCVSIIITSLAEQRCFSRNFRGDVNLILPPRVIFLRFSTSTPNEGKEIADEMVVSMRTFLLWGGKVAIKRLGFNLSLVERRVQFGRLGQIVRVIRPTKLSLYGAQLCCEKGRERRFDRKVRNLTI